MKDLRVLGIIGNFIYPRFGIAMRGRAFYKPQMVHRMLHRIVAFEYMSNQSGDSVFFCAQNQLIEEYLGQTIAVPSVFHNDPKLRFATITGAVPTSNPMNIGFIGQYPDRFINGIVFVEAHHAFEGHGCTRVKA